MSRMIVKLVLKADDGGPLSLDWEFSNKSGTTGNFRCAQ